MISSHLRFHLEKLSHHRCKTFIIVCHYFFSPLSVVLEHLDHFLVATHKLATSVQHTSIDETAFLHDSS